MPQEEALKLVSAQEVDTLRVRPDVQVIDVRLPFDYFGGRVAGSINIPGESLADSLAAIPADRKIIVVCDDGNLSAATARAAIAAGYKDVSILEGGYDAWLEADLPIETISDGVPPPLPMNG